MLLKVATHLLQIHQTCHYSTILAIPCNVLKYLI
jgi:hypothetical protein